MYVSSRVASEQLVADPARRTRLFDPDVQMLDPQDFFADRMPGAKKLPEQYFVRLIPRFYLDHYEARVALTKAPAVKKEDFVAASWREIHRTGALLLRGTLVVEVAPSHHPCKGEVVRVFTDERGHFAIPTASSCSTKNAGNAPPK
jgi:hypothetical protein